MNCTEARKLIDAYIDGELDLVKSLEVEQHLHDCADCARAYQNRMALRAGVRDHALYHRTSAALRKRVQTSIHKADRAGQAPRVRLWLGALVALAAVVVLVFGLARGGLIASPADDALAQEVVSSHVRSQITDHLTDVASSDQHTVKPWFNGKLNYSPPVVDLASQGYPLAGGRLDYLDNRPVAALVYRHNQHVINLFVWPSATGATTPASIETRQGYNLARWTQGGMNYWAVSDVSAAEFGDFVKLLQSSP
jgi:anti-sigma factor RsiW